MKYKIYLHFLLVFLFISIPILSSPDFDGTTAFFKVKMFQKDFLETILVVLFFYFNYFFLIPRFYNKKKFTRYALLVALCYILFSVLPEIIIPHHFPTELAFPKTRPESNRFLFLSLFRKLIPFGFGLLSSFYLKLYIQNREAESEKSKAELRSLKYQLQPHFLFNILNSIYGLSITKSEKTSESILKLSSVMRYVINEQENNTISILEECAYLEDYNGLQLLRTDKSLDFSYRKQITRDDLQIEPMILVNFIENAFKYSYNPEENSKIEIEIKTVEDELYFTCTNTKSKSTSLATNSHKIGLRNVKLHLEKSYFKNYLLEIKETAEEYSVFLKLKLTSK